MAVHSFHGQRTKRGLGLDRRRKLLLAGCSLGALIATSSREWHKSSLTAIRSPTKRRRRWHFAIRASVSSTSEAGIERLWGPPFTDQVSSPGPDPW